MSTIGLSVVFSLAGWAPLIPAEFLVLRGTQVPSCLPSRFRVRGSHPLWPRFPARSAIDQVGVVDGPTTPRDALTSVVWALARSLATTGAIVLTFSSSGYLDVSVPLVRSTSYDAVTGSLPPGSPIRTSAGHRAFAPHRGFSQLVTSFVASESHRHPPCALVRFPFSFRLE